MFAIIIVVSMTLKHHIWHSCILMTHKLRAITWINKLPNQYIFW